MRTLDFCYEIDFSKINFIERKIKIIHPKTIITGASKTGKSYLIYDYLSNFKNEDYIYIDLDDSRNTFETIKNNLDSFLRENKIKVLVIENFDFQFELPYCDNIIISSNIKKEIKGFQNLTITSLDFEEYLLHEIKYQNITQSFNNFFKYGNIPDLIALEEPKKISRLQEIIKLQAKSKTEYQILILLFENIDEKKSLFQMFNTLKNKIKISKDKFYEICKNYENNKTIYFLPKYNQEKAVKKIYSYNFSFLKAISYNKKFKNEFANMIFLEINHKYSDLYYIDYIDFYIKSKNLAIVAIPFFNSLLVSTTLKKIYKSMEKNNIKNLEIITISNNEKIKHNTYDIKVSPFYEWALS